VTPLGNNKALVVGALSMVLAFGIMVALPAIGGIFGFSMISDAQWLVVVGLSVIPIAMREVFRLVDNIR